MNSKAVGIIVFALCIILASVVLILSNVKITKKPTQTANSTSSVVDDESTTENDTKDSSGETIRGTENENTVNMQTYEDYPVMADDDILLEKIVAVDKLKYSGKEIVTKGRIKDKLCYLDGNQVIYCINISVEIGDTEQIMQYFCSYSVYKSLRSGDTLDITYKRPTENTITIISADRP